MKKRYLVAGAVMTLALMTGAAAFAQTATPVDQGAAATVVTVPSPDTTGAPATDQAAPNYGGMMGRYGGNNTNGLPGRGMMSRYAAPAGNYPVARADRGVSVFAVLRLIAAAVTMVMVWVIMLLIIFLLGFKLKKVKMMCKECKEESKK